MNPRLTRYLTLPICLWVCAMPLAATPVQLVTGTGYPPFADEFEPDGGLTVRLVRALFQRLGKEVQLDVLPWKRGYAATLAGKYEATFPYLKTAEREREFLFSQPLIQTKAYLYTLPGRQFDLDRPETLKQQALCMPNGWAATGQEKIDVALAMGRLRLERPNDMHSCIRMVGVGRADGIILIEILAQRLFAVSGQEYRFERSPQPVGTTELALIAPRNAGASAALINSVDRELAAMRADGSYARLLEGTPFVEPGKNKKGR